MWAASVGLPLLGAVMQLGRLQASTVLALILLLSWQGVSVHVFSRLCIRSALLDGCDRSEGIESAQWYEKDSACGAELTMYSIRLSWWLSGTLYLLGSRHDEGVGVR
jgi:hypothetical protein